MSRALPKPFAQLLAIAGIPVLLFASWWSYRMARADILERRPTVADARAAIALTPSSAAAHKNAAAVYSATDPFGGKDREELDAVLKLSPRDSESWMARGLSAEMAGDAAHAEEYLLQAARLNHMFKPAWTLANYYARSGQTEKFWPWIRKCIDLLEHRPNEPGYFDPRPVFSLCWNVTSDGDTIERLAIPARRFPLDQYVTYLVATGRLDAALVAARRLYPLAGSENLQSLYYLCDSLIDRARGTDAAAVWNGIIAGHLPLYDELDPRAGKALTNGRLATEPTGLGFDWRINRPPDIFERYLRDTKTLRFDLNGDETEHCELTSAVVSLLPGKRYRFHFRYRTSEMAGTPGLHWNFSDAVHLERASQAPFPAHEEDAESTFDFVAPADVSLGWLGFRYDRKLGATRPRGSVLLSAMRVELLP